MAVTKSGGFAYTPPKISTTKKTSSKKLTTKKTDWREEFFGEVGAKAAKAEASLIKEFDRTYVPPAPSYSPQAARFEEVGGATGANTTPPGFGRRGRDDWGVGGREYEREELRRQRKI